MQFEFMTSTPRHTIPEWNRANRHRFEALIRALDERTPQARAAFERARSDFQALEREMDRDLAPSPSPEIRITSGVVVASGDVSFTWRALQTIAGGEQSADLLHEVLRAARDPRYHPALHHGRLRQLGLLTHWGMRESVREVVLASLYEIEHGELVEYKLVPPLSVPEEEL